MRTRNIGLLIIIMATFLLTACATSPSDTSDELVGKIWLLEGLNGKPPLPGTSITIEFREGSKVSGSAGCNSYTTTYSVKNDQLSFGDETSTTMMACPEAVMDQENAFIEVLRKTAFYELFIGELVFKDAESKVLASFQTVEQSLSGTSWKVLSYNTGADAVRSVIINTKIVAHFGKVGQLSGNSGCNDYTTNFDTDGKLIQIGAAITTRKICEEPEGIMEQESQYLAALEMATTYSIKGLDMEMRSEDGAITATFTRTIIP